MSITQSYFAAINAAYRDVIETEYKRDLGLGKGRIPAFINWG
jgi:hypothetical protein